MSPFCRLFGYLSLISIYSNGLLSSHNSIAIKRRSSLESYMSSSLESYGIQRTILQPGNVVNSPVKDDTVEIVWFVILPNHMHLNTLLTLTLSTLNRHYTCKLIDI